VASDAKYPAWFPNTHKVPFIFATETAESIRFLQQFPDMQRQAE